MDTMTGSATRQERFRDMLARERIAIALISDPREIAYLTGFLGPSVPQMPALLAIEASGGSWLAAHTTDESALVDERLAYEPHLLFTSNPDPQHRLAEVVRSRASGETGGRVGYQAESLPRSIADAFAAARQPDDWAPIDDQIALLQRRKDPDEVALLRAAARCSIAAYAAVETFIRPGVTEVETLAVGQRAAVEQAREPIFHGGDYRAGQLGGSARDRALPAGELYVIDAWSIYRGYWADLCRTFAIGEPTPLQREIHALIAGVLADVPGQLKPGVDGTEIWRWIDGRLREHPRLRDIGLIHHAGHGVGVRAHEAPDLNRDRGGPLEPGVVVSVEPGAYLPEIGGGVRLENTFLITEAGCELLSDHPFAWS